MSAAALAAVQGVVNSTPPGGTAHYSDSIQAIHNVPGVISVNVPFTDFRRYGESSGTAHDIVEAPDTVPNLAAADFTVIFNLITL
jgi:uncharacterized phage protein gp47/JayE